MPASATAPSPASNRVSRLMRRQSTLSTPHASTPRIRKKAFPDAPSLHEVAAVSPASDQAPSGAAARSTLYLTAPGEGDQAISATPPADRPPRTVFPTGEAAGSTRSSNDAGVASRFPR